MKLHLIQPLFHSDSKEREKELRLVEEINRLRFGEGMSAPEGRLDFTSLFEMCQSDAINIIANSDIAFNETADLFQSIAPEEAWCLARWDRRRDGDWFLNDRKNSQDVWAIRGTPRLAIDAPFTMGQPGCDNRLVHVLKEAGYTIRNPSRSVHCLHYHTGKVRAYREGGKKINVVPPPYGFIHPHAL